MQSHLQDITDHSEFDRLVGDNEWVLLDFYATWCGPCKSLAPVFAEIAQAFEGELVSAKVDIDKAVAIADKFRIRGVPTLALLHNGSPVNTLIGTHSRLSIENWINLNKNLTNS